MLLRSTVIKCPTLWTKQKPELDKPGPGLIVRMRPSLRERERTTAVTQRRLTFRFCPEVPILRADRKDRDLSERDCETLGTTALRGKFQFHDSCRCVCCLM